MEPPNKTWSDIIRQANLTPDILKQTEVLKNVQNILATNVSVCSSLGPPFASQMSHIYIDMLTVYRRAAPEVRGSRFRESNVAHLHWHAHRHEARCCARAEPSSWLGCRLPLAGTLLCWYGSMLSVVNKAVLIDMPGLMTR